MSVPSRRRRTAVVVLLTVTSIAGGLAAAGGPAAEAAGPVAASAPTRHDAAVIDWRGCYTRGLQCGTFRVPLDHDDPGGSEIALALTRWQATDPARRVGAIFMNPGGPGASGAEVVANYGQELFSPEVRARFDIVGFDPRGIALSAPLHCFDAPWLIPDLRVAFPDTPRQERAQLQYDRAFNEQCDAHAGDIVDHMSTANVARDLDAMREAIGDEQLTFVGYSYGSYIGATYAAMFPDRVRAIVVDGVLDPVEWAAGSAGDGSTVPFSARINSAAGAWATLRAFFRECDARPRRCSFSAGSPRERFDAIAQRLRTNPVRGATGSVIYTYSDLVGETLSALYSVTSWSDLADWLTFVWDDRNAGDSAAFTRAHQRFLRQARLMAPSPQSFEGFPGVACSETDNPTDPADWRRLGDAEDADHPYFGRLWLWASSVCAQWPGADPDRFTGPFGTTTANPLLVVGNLYDPATPLSGARSMATMFPNARLLTVEGWGHTSLYLSRCADRAVNQYLLSRTLPAPGARCTADVEPFTPYWLEGRPDAASRQAIRNAIVDGTRLPLG